MITTVPSPTTWEVSSPARRPLDDIHNTNTVKLVMKNGELFEGDTLNKIWPEREELAPLWWWDEEP